MGLREGKNREIKNVLGALGLDVNRLIRISYGPFQLGELPEGHVQEIRGRTLRDQLGPRLIEDAKANFDAPIYNDQSATLAARSAGRRSLPTPASPSVPTAGKSRKTSASARFPVSIPVVTTAATVAVARMGRAARKVPAARVAREERGDAKFEDRPKRTPAQRARTANVWMAPGARPLAEKKPKSAEGDASATPARRERPDGAAEDQTLRPHEGWICDEVIRQVRSRPQGRCAQGLRPSGFRRTGQAPG